MSLPIPTDCLDLFSKPAFAHLATLMPDGSPQVTPVWIDYDGTYLLVNAAAGRQKNRNMAKRSRVAVDIMDPDYPYRYLAVRGAVVEIVTEGADAQLERLAQRYLGTPYPAHWRREGEVRQLFKIEIAHVTRRRF